MSGDIKTTDDEEEDAAMRFFLDRLNDMATVSDALKAYMREYADRDRSGWRKAA